MQLPKGQTLILDEDRVPLAEWRSGPLPDQRLEQIAQKIFMRQFPSAAWGDPVFTIERDDARGFAIQLAIDFAKRDHWTLSNAAERLADVTAYLVFGDRRLGKTLRKEVADFAASYISDCAIVFRNRLFWPKQVEENNAEVEAEANS